MPCIIRQFTNHWTIREVPPSVVLEPTSQGDERERKCLCQNFVLIPSILVPHFLLELRTGFLCQDQRAAPPPWAGRIYS